MSSAIKIVSLGTTAVIFSNVKTFIKHLKTLKIPPLNFSFGNEDYLHPVPLMYVVYRKQQYKVPRFKIQIFNDATREEFQVLADFINPKGLYPLFAVIENYIGMTEGTYSPITNIEYFFRQGYFDVLDSTDTDSDDDDQKVPPEKNPFLVMMDQKPTV